MAKHIFNKTRTDPWIIDTSGDTWILGEKGRIISGNSWGILAPDSITAATIRIDGTIDMTNGAGIAAASESTRISIGETGHVSTSGTVGVAFYYNNPSGTVTIDNKGLLEGYEGIDVLAAKAGGVTIRNDGRILATNIGIYTNGAGAEITNSGTIKVDEYGIYAQGDGTKLTTEDATRIVNTGKVTGSYNSVYAEGVAVNIRNKGTLNGDVEMGDGHDVLNNRGGTINGDIYSGAGDDVFRMAGGTVNGDIFGRNGNDVFNMVGGKLNGVIYGGVGDDVVTLGSMTQVYVEYANEGIDTVRINSTYQLGGNIENLTLLGKANHTGIGNSLDNTITGNKGGNVLYGMDGYDMLYGGKGSDRLYGQDSDDKLDGGKGNDILTGGADGDMFIFKAGYGRDTITDFESGADIINLGSFGFNAYDAVEALMTEKANGDLVITFSDADRLIIRDGVGNVVAGDFELWLP